MIYKKGVASRISRTGGITGTTALEVITPPETGPGVEAREGKVKGFASPLLARDLVLGRRLVVPVLVSAGWGI